MKYENVTKPGGRTTYRVFFDGEFGDYTLGEVEKLGDRWFIPGAIGVSACEIGTYKTRKEAARALHVKDIKEKEKEGKESK